MTITLALLRRQGACHDQLEAFERIFGVEAPMTVEAAVAHAKAFAGAYIQQESKK